MEDNEIQQLRMMQNITLEHFDFSKYPEHVSLDKYNGNNCTYAWKPIILHDVCEKYGGLVMWMDTRTLYSDFNALIKILENHYIYSPISGGNIKKWTYPSCIEYMNGSKYSNLPPRAGGIIAVNYNIEWVKKLVTEWKDMSLHLWKFKMPTLQIVFSF